MASFDDFFDPTVAPSGTGCVECLATEDGWWFHLRRCAKCEVNHWENAVGEISLTEVLELARVPR